MTGYTREYTFFTSGCSLLFTPNREVPPYYKASINTINKTITFEETIFGETVIDVPQTIPGAVWYLCNEHNAKRYTIIHGLTYDGTITRLDEIDMYVAIHQYTYESIENYIGSPYDDEKAKIYLNEKIKKTWSGQQ